MSLRKLTIVTSNAGKVREIKALLTNFEINFVDLNLNEYQGEPAYVVDQKCREAAKLINGPVLVEDTSLCFNAMGGLPGVYIKWFLEKLKAEGLFKMLEGFEDKTAYAQCMFAYTEGVDKEVHTFAGKCPGSIVSPRGPRDFGWDPCFEPEGHQQTFAEMDKNVKNSISHRSKALDMLKKYFEQNSS